MEGRVGGALGCVIAVQLGCTPAGTFTCKTDTDCVDGEHRGICQPSHYCSFGDDTCPSGQRYGGLAGEGLAQTCVPTEPIDPSPPTTSPPFEPSASGPAGEASTQPVDETESGSKSSTSTAADAWTGSGTSSSTEGGPSCPDVDEAFDKGALGEPWTVMGDEQYVEVADGDLVLTITAPEDGWVRVQHETAVDLSAASVEIEVTQAPAATASLLSLTISAGEAYFAIMIEGQLLVAHRGVGDIFVDEHVANYDATLHRYLRLRTDPGLVQYETSEDGSSWVEFFSLSTLVELHEAAFSVSASNYAEIAMDETVSVSSVRAHCTR